MTPDEDSLAYYREMAEKDERFESSSFLKKVIVASRSMCDKYGIVYQLPTQTPAEAVATT